jgi:hypothetical protein
MKATTRCGISGKVLINSENSEMGWVDEKGIMHKFPASLDGKRVSCTSSPMSVSPQIFKSFQVGDEMTETSECDTLGGDPVLKNKLILSGNKMKRIAAELIQHTKKIATVNNTLTDSMAKKQQEVNNKITQLDQNEQYMHDATTTKGQFKDSTLEYNAEYYKYLSWTIGAVLVGFMTIRYIRSSD